MVLHTHRMQMTLYILFFSPSCGPKCPGWFSRLCVIKRTFKIACPIFNHVLIAILHACGNTAEGTCFYICWEGTRVQMMRWCNAAWSVKCIRLTGSAWHDSFMVISDLCRASVSTASCHMVCISETLENLWGGDDITLYMWNLHILKIPCFNLRLTFPFFLHFNVRVCVSLQSFRIKSISEKLSSISLLDRHDVRHWQLYLVQS